MTTVALCSLVNAEFEFERFQNFIELVSINFIFIRACGLICKILFVFQNCSNIMTGVNECIEIVLKTRFGE